eukprot:2852461-Amphidinium_carterae.1
MQLRLPPPKPQMDQQPVPVKPLPQLCNAELTRKLLRRPQQCPCHLCLLFRKKAQCPLVIQAVIHQQMSQIPLMSRVSSYQMNRRPVTEEESNCPCPC